MAKSTDYIPDSDADFDAWLQNFVTYVTANAASLGVSANEVTALQDVKDGWDAKYPASKTANAAAQSARQAKDDSRQRGEDRIRPMVGKMQANVQITDAQRLAMDITVRSTTRTPVGPPTTKPIATVDTSQRLRHTISFVDELTPTSRAKPDGVQGCEIWTKIGNPAPAGPDDVKYLALDTRSPYLTEFDAADAGKTAYYLLRWLSTRSEAGPWSQTVSGTITN